GGGRRGWTRRRASPSPAAAAPTPNSPPRAPAGALRVVPHATVCDAAVATPVPSPAPHAAASTATTRPARFRFMPSPPCRADPVRHLLFGTGRAPVLPGGERVFATAAGPTPRRHSAAGWGGGGGGRGGGRGGVGFCVEAPRRPG